MACCKVCCGCADCTEGQEGKCCCGGSSGECCQTGEYCCSGVCQSTPCGGACCLPGGCLFQSGAIWSGDEPEAIPGYTKIPGGWQRLYVDGDCVALSENSQMNQDWFDAVLGVDPGAVPISGSWVQVAPSCEAAESQLACEEQGGTFYAGQTCEEICCGPCDEENPCPEDCECVDGQCVQAGCCCVNGTPDGSITSQSECEACETVNTCTEYLFLENNEDPCPEGWDGSGGFCYRTTNPASCADCDGECFSSEQGNCGDWQPGIDCENLPAHNCTAESVCTTWPATVASLAEDASIAGGCPARDVVLWLSGEQLDLQSGGSYAWSSGGGGSSSLAQQCGRWVYSGGGSGTIAPFAIVSMQFDLDCGAVTDGACDPEDGMTCTGTLYWQVTDCVNSIGQSRNASGAISVSVTIGACP